METGGGVSSKFLNTLKRYKKKILPIMSTMSKVFSGHLFSSSAISVGEMRPIYEGAGVFNGLDSQGGEHGQRGCLFRGVQGPLYPPDGDFPPSGCPAGITPEIEFWSFACLCALSWGQGAQFSGSSLWEAIVGPLYLNGMCLQRVNLMQIVDHLKSTPVHRLIEAATPLLGGDYLGREVRRLFSLMDRRSAAHLVYSLKEYKEM